MSWNQLRPSDAQRLNRIPNWEKRGLAYWERRVEHCYARLILARFSSAQARRAMVDWEIAKEAVRQLVQAEAEHGL